MATAKPNWSNQSPTNPNVWGGQAVTPPTNWGEVIPPVVDGMILMESLDFFLLESGDYFLLE